MSRSIWLHACHSLYRHIHILFSIWNLCMRSNTLTKKQLPLTTWVNKEDKDSGCLGCYTMPTGKVNDTSKYCNAFICRVKQFKKSLCLHYLTLNMKTLRSFNLAVIIYQSAWHNISQDWNLQQQCCGNLNLTLKKKYRTVSCPCGHHEVTQGEQICSYTHSQHQHFDGGIMWSTSHPGHFYIQGKNWAPYPFWLLTANRAQHLSTVPLFLLEMLAVIIIPTLSACQNTATDNPPNMGMVRLLFYTKHINLTAIIWPQISKCGTYSRCEVTFLTSYTLQYTEWPPQINWLTKCHFFPIHTEIYFLLFLTLLL